MKKEYGFFVIESPLVWELVMETEKQITIKMYHQDIGKYIICTFVYAKCFALERLELWDNIYILASDMKIPWLVSGDFSVHEDENISSLLVHPTLEY